MQSQTNERLQSSESIGFSDSNDQKGIRSKKHPGVYVPPPIIYVLFFLLSILLQKHWPLERGWLNTRFAQATGWLMIGLYFILAFSSIRQFVISKNTIVPIKPATSLQTSGIYALTRNPMYLSLIFLYSGIAVFSGNWWTFLLLPFLAIVIQLYVIQKEEQYLQHAFGAEYKAYRKKVRRWM